MGNSAVKPEAEGETEGPRVSFATPRSLGGSLKPKADVRKAGLCDEVLAVFRQIVKPKVEGELRYPEAVGLSAVQVTPGEAGGVYRVVRDGVSLSVMDLCNLESALAVVEHSEVEGLRAVQVTPGEAGGVYSVVRDGVSLSVMDLCNLESAVVEAEGSGAVRLTPDEAEGLYRVVRDEVSLSVMDLRNSEGTVAAMEYTETEGGVHIEAYRRSPGRLEPGEAETETGWWYQNRMIRVTEGEQSSSSEIQFRVVGNIAPLDNIPPLPVDSHEADMSPHFAWPPGEGRETEAGLSRSPTMVGKTGFGVGATLLQT